MFNLTEYIASFAGPPLAAWAGSTPWELTAESESIVRQLLTAIDATQFAIDGDVAIHRTATIEQGATLKGPLIISARTFIASNAYLRGGNWVDERCVIGPGVELKSSFVFRASRLAHFNYVGDSILGEDVNFEAVAVVRNHRNERATSAVMVRVGTGLHDTGCAKFGALIADRARVGANAVLAPGTQLRPGAVVARGALVDQEVGAA